MKKLIFLIVLVLVPVLGYGQIIITGGGGSSPLVIGGRIAVSSPGGLLIASGSVTRANTKISAVDGTAFVDFSTANVLTNYAPKSKFTLTDSTGKKLEGYIKAAGTGETFTNRYTSDFSAGADGWTGVRSTVEGNIDSIGGQDDWLRSYANTETAYHYTNKAFYSAGARYKLSFTYYLPSGQTSVTRFIPYIGTLGFSGYQSTTNTVTSVVSDVNIALGNAMLYFHPASATSPSFAGANSATDDVYYLKNILLDQHVTPSTTGVTITSTADGTTYNWASKEAGFNYNDASGYTYTIERE